MLKKILGLFGKEKTVNRKMIENCSPVYQWDLVISADKLNLKQKSLEFFIKSKNLNLSYIDIPLWFINRMIAIGAKKYSTIKKNYSAILLHWICQKLM